MGFRQAAVLASVSFFAGILCICQTIDYRVLYALDEQTVQDGMVFYASFYNSPPAIKALLHGMIGVGILGLISKLHKWDDSAFYFDGSALAALIFSVSIYLSVTVPALRTVIVPAKEDFYEDQVQALQLVSAGNVINLAVIALILGLQAGQEWAKRTEKKAVAQLLAEEKANTTAVTAEKKGQY